jgi:hypothetical protein
MRRPVPRVEVLDPAVCLIAGQSNAANHGQGRFTAQNNVFNFNPFDGQLYQAADPLLGATSTMAVLGVCLAIAWSPLDSHHRSCCVRLLLAGRASWNGRQAGHTTIDWPTRWSAYARPIYGLPMLYGTKVRLMR